MPRGSAMAELKSRKKSGPRGAPAEPALRSEGRQRPEARAGASWADPRAGLSLLSLGTCLGLAWFVFQQSEKFAKVERQYQLLQTEVKGFQGLQSKIDLISEKCRESAAVTEQLKPGQVAARVRRLQKETQEVRTWSGRITGAQERLRGNLTALSRDVTRVDQSAAAAATDAGLKIAAARTDVRRISGLLGDVAALAQSVKELEEKLEAVEDRTVRDIGHLLSSSVDRTAALRQAAAANAERIGAARQALAALAGGLDEHTARFLGLESDRAKVLKAVSFANELKPKVSSLRKDFARLEPLVNDLTLRIGRLVTDLVQREKEIALLGEKIANLTVVRAEIAAVKAEIAHISDMD